MEDLLTIKKRTGQKEIYSGRVSNSIEQEIFEILNPQEIALEASAKYYRGTESAAGEASSLKLNVFKDIGAEEIKQIKKLYDRYLNGRIMTVKVANDVAVLTRNSKLRNMLTKDGKVPSLNDLNKALYENYVLDTPGLTSGEAAKRLNRIVDYMMGKDIILPFK